MASNTDQIIADLRDSLTPYAEAVSGDTAAITALYCSFANRDLEIFLNATAAYMNISASAASSYSTAVGSSVQKRAEDSAKDAMDGAWNSFVDTCKQGGQTLPSMGDAATYWDLSGRV